MNKRLFQPHWSRRFLLLFPFSRFYFLSSCLLCILFVCTPISFFLFLVLPSLLMFPFLAMFSFRLFRSCSCVVPLQIYGRKQHQRGKKSQKSDSLILCTPDFAFPIQQCLCITMLSSIPPFLFSSSLLISLPFRIPSFSYPHFVYPHRSLEPSRAYVRARLPTAMLIFCCHKCHTRRENVSKTKEKF